MVGSVNSMSIEAMMIGGLVLTLILWALGRVTTAFEARNAEIARLRRDLVLARLTVATAAGAQFEKHDGEARRLLMRSPYRDPSVDVHLDTCPCQAHADPPPPEAARDAVGDVFLRLAVIGLFGLATACLRLGRVGHADAFEVCGAVASGLLGVVTAVGVFRWGTWRANRAATRAARAV